ncbi:MAG: 50S ribosomal protein L25 [Pedosphaera sp.]|nr:50S ribosomal protein L25 [Pedosphaera sp.]
MKSVALHASPRSLARRKGSRAVRARGQIPANVYGKSAPAQNLELNAKEFGELVHAAHSEIILVDLAIEGDARPARLALVQDVQHHPLSGDVLHVDFHEVKPDEMVTIRVPVESIGESVGVKSAGGTLEHVLLKLRVRSLPKDLPDQISVDVSALNVGDSIHLGDIQPPAGVEILGDKHLTVLAVAAPIAEVVETPAEGAAVDAKQPEMLKEKKEDGAAPGADAKAGDKKPADKKK